MRWNLRSPFYSSAANDVIENLTPQERWRSVRRSIAYTLWLGLTGMVALVIVAAVFGGPAIMWEPEAGVPYKLSGNTRFWLLIAAGLEGLFVTGSLYWLRTQRRFLAATQWAVSQGVAASLLPLFRPWSRAVAVSVMGMFALSAVAGVVWPWVPGTMHFDDHGFPRGTGWRTDHYRAGSTKLEEYYRNGQLTLARWYRPDGTLVGEVLCDKPRELFYFLRDDGSIANTMEAKRATHGADYIADGKYVHYRADGAVEREETYVEGKPVGGWPGERRN